MSGLNITACTIRRVHVSRDRQPCPECGDEAPRVAEAERTAVDIDLNHPVLLVVQVSVHHCRRCGCYFRLQPPFLRTDAIYTNRVVAKAIHSVYQDRMAMRRVAVRLARDFWVQPSEGVIRVWCRNYGQSLDFRHDYQRWVVESFSGVLCVDEVYQGKLALLLAVDPRAPDGDRLVGYQLTSGPVDGSDVEAFLTGLARAGVVPYEVVTDGSALYPTAIARVWPSAVHQLCLFHESRRVVRAADEVRKAVAAALPRAPKAKGVDLRGRVEKAPLTGAHSDAPSARYLAREAGIARVHALYAEGSSLSAIARKTGFCRKTVRKWLREATPSELGQESLADGVLAAPDDLQRPPPPAPWTSWHEVAETQTELRACRYLLMRRPDHLAGEERERLDALLASPAGPKLKVARRFLEDWYSLWRDEGGGRPSLPEAQERHRRWREEETYRALPSLARVIRRVDVERFRSLSHFLKQPEWEATSNGAERAGRRFRHWQGPHYNLRALASIEAAIVAQTMIDRQVGGAVTALRPCRSTRGRRPRGAPLATAA